MRVIKVLIIGGLMVFSFNASANHEDQCTRSVTESSWANFHDGVEYCKSMFDGPRSTDAVRECINAFRLQLEHESYFQYIQKCCWIVQGRSWNKSTMQHEPWQKTLCINDVEWLQD